MADVFEIGTVENLTGADASALDGAKYELTQMTPPPFILILEVEIASITDEEFASYWTTQKIYRGFLLI